ncbi:MAG: hypothetical protein PWQ31_992 [Eubacteriales bacterium]|nr:hypothetical protein [Eubacteriales bacterium]
MGEGRIVEAFIGEYASGKSENAVNRALMLARAGRKVTLVDLDLVEPFYTLRPIARKLEKEGVRVIAWETSETMGLGEAGSVLKPEMRWALLAAGDVILDIGYGVHGAKILNMLEGVDQTPELKVYAVINIFRPMTSTVDAIVEFVRSLGRVDGLINNSHVGEETTIEMVCQGARVVAEAAAKLGLPVIATSALKPLAEKIGPRDCVGNPVWPLQRFMDASFW